MAPKKSKSKSKSKGKSKSKSKAKSKSPNKSDTVTAPKPKGDVYQYTFGYSTINPANCKAGSELRPLRTQKDIGFKNLVEQLTKFPWDNNSVITGKEDVPEEGTPERAQYPVPLKELIQMNEEEVSSESRFHHFLVKFPSSLFFFFVKFPFSLFFLAPHISKYHDRCKRPVPEFKCPRGWWTGSKVYTNLRSTRRSQ